MGRRRRGPPDCGYGWIAWLGGVSRQVLRTTVSAASRAPLDASDPVRVVAWALRRRGHPELADKVLGDLDG